MRPHLAPENPPTEDLPAVLSRLAAAAEALAQAPDPGVLEIKLFTPAEAAPLLGKTENWVLEACSDGRIPCTYVGKSPRLTAAHLRQIAADGERQPRRRSRATPATATRSRRSRVAPRPAAA